MKIISLVRCGAVVLSLYLLPGAFVSANASVIAQFTGGLNGAAPLFIGQSFTTAAGGPFNDITFNFFSDTAGGTTPSGAGDLFILSQQYVGTPSGLSAATPGFLAESTGVAGGIFAFDPILTLQGNTQYFIYGDTSFLVSGDNGGGYAGGSAFVSAGAGADYAVISGDANFRLSGTQVVLAVPAPATLSLVGLGLAGLGASQRRRKLSA